MFDWLTPSPVDGPRLRLLPAVLEGYRFTFRYAGKTLWLTLLPALCLTGIHFALFGFAPPSDDPEAALGVAMASLGEFPALILFITMAVVAWQRRILLGPEFAKMRFGRRELRMLVTLLLLGLMIALGNMAAMTLVDTIAGMVGEVENDMMVDITFVAINFATAYVTGRLYFMLPPRAMDRKLSVGEAWDMSAGYGMKLTAVIVLAGFPVTALSQIVSQVTMAALQNGAIPLLVGSTLLGYFLFLFSILVEAAALTICYAALGGVDEILEARGFETAQEPELVPA